jgi:hypothetical protein
VSARMARSAPATFAGVSMPILIVESSDIECARSQSESGRIICGGSARGASEESVAPLEIL